MAGAAGSVVGAALFGADPVQYLLGLPALAFSVCVSCRYCLRGPCDSCTRHFPLVRIARAMRTEPAAPNMR